MMRSTEKRIVTIPDGLGKVDFSRRDVSLPRAPWDASRSSLAERPETAPRQPIILTATPRRPTKGAALGAAMVSLIAEELRRPRDEYGPTEVFI
ncbi:hypothetical protein [Thioclava sp. GXIMD2076]|uniref:hypothetical protein n=1 Tax=Thioclava sp. GXIMD2076 TaxID=3131931 RepID=UPI0030CC99BB